MCGRYNLQLRDDFRQRFAVDDLPKEVKTSYNIVPSQMLPVIVRTSPNHVEMMRWGLVPFWSKDGKETIINVRSESAIAKPMFIKLLRFQRCLAPATGFYEWKKTKEGKQPYHICLKTQGYFSFAGVYDTWQSPQGNSIKTYAILTTIPNQLMEQIHNRMPVILKKEAEDKWLDRSIDRTQELIKYCQPYPETEMEAYPISLRINNPLNNSQNLLDKIDNAIR